MPTEEQEREQVFSMNVDQYNSLTTFEDEHMVPHQGSGVYIRRQCGVHVTPLRHRSKRLLQSRWLRCISGMEMAQISSMQPVPSSLDQLHNTLVMPTEEQAAAE
jgi:hypothetical protein